MNSYLKLMPLIMAFMMCDQLAAWAGANANAPYCEHDPACWEPNDDPSTWYGTDCCRHKEEPPQPHPDPDDHCWEYNWDDCKWERRTPDCSAENNSVIKLELAINTYYWRIQALVPLANKAIIGCDCNNGVSGACAIAMAGNNYPPPANACDERDRLLRLIDAYKYTMNLAVKELPDAKKILDDCLKCKK